MTQIYQPLKNQRLADIEFYKRRKDYVQLYSVQDFDKRELLALLDNIFIENSNFRMKNQLQNIEQAKILWLISIIDKKMQTCFEIGHNIFSQTISAQSELWNITV